MLEWFSEIAEILYHWELRKILEGTEARPYTLSGLASLVSTTVISLTASTGPSAADTWCSHHGG